MLAHQNQVDTGNNLLKIADGPVMMSAESYESELSYHQQHVPGRIELGLNEQTHYYQHEGYDQQQQQQQQHFQNNGHHNEIPAHNLNPHHQHQQHHPQQVIPQQEYYQQQQMMYNQGMSNYNYPSEQYYYQQHPQSNVPPGNHHHGPYPFQPSQSVIVNNGPASHGSHNCTPSPHANSDDSGGDCVNEPKMLQIGATSVYGHHGGLPYTNQFNPDPLMNDRTVGQKALIPAANINRNLTAPRRGKKSKHRDPNEPQKPVSAYALFFRDTQAGIKMRNPNSSFGDVSKHVASLWDGLDPENKAVYKRRTETAKKEYLKSLAAYRASLVSKGGSPPCNPGPEPLATRYPENAMQSDRKEMLNLKDISSSSTSPNSQTLLGSPPSSYQPLGVIGRTSPQSIPVTTSYNSQVMFARTLSIQNGDNTNSHYSYQQPQQNLTHHQGVPHGGNNNPQFISQHQPQLTKLT